MTGATAPAGTEWPERRGGGVSADDYRVDADERNRPRDCLLNVCDGGGKVTVKPLGVDAPVTDNECKIAFCGADGLPHIEPKMAG